MYLYEMDRYELVKDSSSELEKELEIENPKVYDKFSRALERSKEDADYDALFNAIKELDMGDISSIISGLDNNSLYVVLQALKNNIDYNVVLAVKVFFSIVEHHRYFVAENQSAYVVYKEIRGRVELLRQLIKENEYKIGINGVMDG
ncbi:hypothetical protein THOM_0438 [Trachipleistophora hominis]|uniref:Uncharacterized protein n=1 Tax=Trachipleistophora hominis TaxID=72359 RepID=L7JZ19_TRAHO|nr:hypothetical protein THOM_0438 [Trachipleistophora hominis]